ncbi:hypothetical protein LIPSTDRAFT_73566, partial [Lipomyces starkeyi NRRL Y-11557]
FQPTLIHAPIVFGGIDVEIREDRPTISIDENFATSGIGKISANTCASNFKAPQTKAGDALFDAQGMQGGVCRDTLFCRNQG